MAMTSTKATMADITYIMSIENLQKKTNAYLIVNDIVSMTFDTGIIPQRTDMHTMSTVIYCYLHIIYT